MFENLLSVESLLSLSVGAICSFKIGKVNLNLKNSQTNQSTIVYGGINKIIYNEKMAPVRKEISFSAKVVAAIMAVFFPMYPMFFVNLLLSLTFIFPFVCFVGVIASIRWNGLSQGWNILYPMASLIMSAFFYCSAMILSYYASLYQQLIPLYHSISGYSFSLWGGWPRQIQEIVFILISSIACPSLILLGFYLAFAYTKARNGNAAFAYVMSMLVGGYTAYLLIGGLFPPDQMAKFNYVQLLVYPFKILLSLYPF